MGIGDRVRQIRDDQKMTQEEFANRIGIKRPSVASIETNVREPSNPVVTMICREFNVNETWLRTGEGEMYIQRSKKEQIAELFRQVSQDDDESVRKQIIATLADYTPEDWEILGKALKRFLQK